MRKASLHRERRTKSEIPEDVFSERLRENFKSSKAVGLGSGFLGKDGLLKERFSEKGGEVRRNKSREYCKILEGIVGLHSRKLSAEEKKEVSKRIDMNKDIAIMPLEMRRKLSLEKAFQSKIRANINKIAKEKIYQDKKMNLQEAYREKIKRFGYHMNRKVKEI